MISLPLEILFALALMLGVLITVHEFGHFAVAKLCGVRVLKFSIGFGPPIGIGRFRLAWHRGGTDYVIAWFPLGGFVKMLGENPDEADAPETRADRAHSLPAKPTWQKLAIVFAGPAMNLILPIFVFAAILASGVERRAPVVGTVEPGSPAAAAGIRPSDRIAGMDGEPVAWWDEFEEEVRERPGESLDLVVARDGEERRVTLPVRRREGVDLFQVESEVGWIGLRHTRQKPLVGVPEAESPARQAGLRSGDHVEAVAGTPVEDWTGFAAAYAAQERGPVALTVRRGEGEDEQVLEVEVPALGSLRALGVIPAVVLVADVTQGSPAERAGLRPGDLIVSVDGETVGSFATFRETVLGSRGRTLQIQYARDGETDVVAFAPELAPSPIEGMEDEVWLIGIQGANALLPGATATDQVANPLVAIPRATVMTVELTKLFLDGLGRLISGEISRRNVGGPIEIAKQSHMALQAGWDRFLHLLVLISINLGILNLLPIPILDGGQALMFIVEGVKRQPLSLRTREIVQQVGLAILVALMGFAFWNDISRHWVGFVEWVKGL